MNRAGLVEQALEGGEAPLREGLAVAVAVEGALVGVEAEGADLELVARRAGETKAGLGEPTQGGAHRRAVVQVRGDGDRCSVVRGAGHQGLLPAFEWPQAQGIAFSGTGLGWIERNGR